MSYMLNQETKRVLISTLKPGDWFMLHEDRPVKMSSIEKITARPSDTGPRTGSEITCFDFHTDETIKMFTPHPDIDVPEEVKVTKYKVCFIILDDELHLETEDGSDGNDRVRIRDNITGRTIREFFDKPDVKQGRNLC